MGWVKHVWHLSRSFSVVILVVQQDYVFSFESECQPPHSINPDGPVSGKVVPQRVEIVSGTVGIFGNRGNVENAELLSQPIGMFRLNTCFTPCSKELLEALVLEAADHIANCIAYRYTMQLA